MSSHRMKSISENLAQVRGNISKAAKGRSVQLLAVSKTFPCEAILEAYEAGQRLFGENYAQEGAAKVDFFNTHYPSNGIEWHFIGPLQSNKTRLIAERFQWVESICRLKTAQRLSDQRPRNMPPLNILVEVNIDAEESKSGVSVQELEALLVQLKGLPNLCLRGLMCIPKAQASEEEKRKTFSKMKALFDNCIKKGYSFDTLSMGMSADYIIAIEEGSTLVRVGSSIFGARDYSK